MPSEAPPHDLEAERAVLGGVLLDNGALADVEALVAPEQFYAPAHATIFGAMLALARRGEPIDVVTLAHELRADERLAQVGGAQYLGELTDVVPTIAHIERHARIVADHARVRDLVLGMREAIALAHAGARHDAVADRVQRLALAAGGRAGESEPRHIGDALERMFGRLEARARGERAPGIATGFADLDRVLIPLRPGHLIIVAGRPSMGKTSLVNRVCVNAAAGDPAQGVAGVPTLFFSLETKEEDLADRTAAMEASVDVAMVQRTAPDAASMVRLVAAAKRLHGLPLWFDDGYELSVAALRRKARRHAQRHGLGLIAIDYLQLMRATQPGKRDRVHEISEISRELKALAKELGVPIVALSQLNRGPEGRTVKDHRPRLADLRDSGAVEQDADAVVFVYRDEVYHRDSPDRGLAELIVAKQKNGPTETVKVRFVREATRFEDLPDPRASQGNDGHDADRDDGAEDVA